MARLKGSTDITPREDDDQEAIEVSGIDHNDVYVIDDVPHRHRPHGTSLSDQVCPVSDDLTGVPDETNNTTGGIQITRPAYNQELFDDILTPVARHKRSIRERISNATSNFKCSRKCVKSFLLNHLPFTRVIGNYKPRKYLLGDVIGGLTVGIMHIPQGMAYGLLTTLPPVYGLYVSFLPTLLYFIMGTSRHISVGTFAVVSLMVGSVVEKANCDAMGDQDSNNYTQLDPEYTMLENNTQLYDNNDTLSTDTMSHEELTCRVGVAMALTFITGIVQFGMGLCRLGFVTIYLSEPLTRGLTTGAAIHVFTSQIKHVFGIKVASQQGPLKLVYTYIDFFSHITETNLAALIMSVISVLALALVKEFANPKVKKAIKMPIPMELIVVILGTVTSYYWGMVEKFGITVVGDIPTGMPMPAFPPVNRFTSVTLDAVSIALVAFAINVSMAKLFAKKNNYEIDANQELMAYGVCNFVGSILNCFASAASLSRSLVQEGVGGKTQVVGLVSSVLLLIVLFALGPLFEQLPKCVLAVIIVVNLKGMFLQFNDLKMLWKISKYDFWVWLVVFVGVVLLDVDIGMGLGIGFCLLTVVFRTQSPYTSIIGRVPSTEIYKNIAIYHGAEEIPGVKIFRFESSLYFANSEYFVQKLYAETVDPRKMLMQRTKIAKNNKAMQKRQNDKSRKRNKNGRQKENTENHEIVDAAPNTIPVTHIILDCSTMGYVDYVGTTTLRQVIEEYIKVDITICLAGCKVIVREMFETAGSQCHIDKGHLFISVHDAVLMATKSHSSSADKLTTTEEESNTKL